MEAEMNADKIDTGHFGKAELLQEVDGTWTELNEALGELTEEQMTEVRDGEGWTVKDHIIHMAAWERSVVALLQGRPRYEGLGVDRQLFLTGGEDSINAAIQKQRRDIPAGVALAELHEVHTELLGLLTPLDDVDLSNAVSDYLPGEPGARDERPIGAVIYGNTADHFREHQEWIAQMIAPG
jgi:Protein of unknown function (DUF1706)